jgi:hypothetical protein
MSILENAHKSVTNKPLIITLFGAAGSGKTSLACEFPDAFMIQTRGESVPRDVPHNRRPAQLDAIGGRTKKDGENTVWDEDELFGQLMALVREDHPYKTLIIDSVTGLESLFVSNIIETQPPKQKTMNSAMSGYGSAWDAVAGKHSRIKKAAEILRDKKGMTVIFLCHTEVIRLDPPDGEPYSKYDLQLNRKTAPVYINESDVVGFVTQETLTKDGKARTTGDRIVKATMSPAYVCKNRLGLTDDLVYTKGENPFIEYMTNTVTTEKEKTE